MVKKFAYGIAFTLAAMITSNASAGMLGAIGDGNTSLIYDPATGELSIEAEAGPVAFAEISSMGSIFTGDAVISPPGTALTTDDDNLLGFVSFAGSLIAQGETFSLGNVAQAGLDQAAILADLDWQWNPAPGQANVIGDIVFAGVAAGIELTGPAGLLADGDTIDLQSIWDDFSDRLNGAITAANGTITDIALTNNNGEVFGAELNNGAIDLSIDRSVARLLAENTEATADLTVTTDDGTFGFTLRAVVPEPTTFGLAGLAMVGLVGLRRRS